MTLGELREAIDGLPDDLEIVLELEVEDGDALYQATLDTAQAEERCDETECLYLFGVAV